VIVLDDSGGDFSPAWGLERAAPAAGRVFAASTLVPVESTATGADLVGNVLVIFALGGVYDFLGLLCGVVWQLPAFFDCVPPSAE